MKRAPPPPPTRKNAPKPKTKPASTLPIQFVLEESNSDPPPVVAQQQPQELVSNPIAQETVPSPQQEPANNIPQEKMPIQTLDQPAIVQDQSQPPQNEEVTLTFSVKSEKPKGAPLNRQKAVKGKAPPPPTKTTSARPNYSPPKNLVETDPANVPPPQPKVEENFKPVQEIPQSQTETEKHQPQQIKIQPSKEITEQPTSPPPRKTAPVPPPKTQKRKQSPPQSAAKSEILNVSVEPEFKVEPSVQTYPLETPQKVQISEQKPAKFHAVSEISPGSSNSKLYEKMLKLRQAKEQLAADSEGDSEQSREASQQQSKPLKNVEKERDQIIQLEKQEDVVQQKIIEVQQNPNASPSVFNYSDNSPPNPRTSAPPSPPLPPPRSVPPPVRNATKAPVRKVNPPPPTVTSKPQFRQPVEKTEIKQEKRIQALPPIQTIVEHSQENLIQQSKDISPPSSSEPLQQVQMREMVFPPPVEKTSVTVTRSKKNISLLSEINSLLGRYHTLKASYLSSIHELEQQLNFQKQQEEAEVDKINHLIAELAKKNKRIKNICMGKAQPLIEGEALEVDSAAV